MGTLRPAAPPKLRRWHLLAFIAVLLLLRAVIYWWIGSETNWAGKLNLGVVVFWFSSGSHWVGFWHMVLFSFSSYGLVLGVFYVWLLLLSLLAGPLPIQGLVTIPLGRVDGWPRWARALLPFFATAMLWWLASWLLIRLQILTPMPTAGRFQQSLVLGLRAYPLWQYPLEVILLLHLLNSYIYFGKHPLWKYVSVTAQTILRPLGKIPLRVSKVDFAPLIGLGLIFLAAHFAERGLNQLYNRLPF
jgi:uncharacterized protein YggT (Ycf19 family)